MLKQLSLIFKHGLQFLNALRFSSKNEIVLSVGQSSKISLTVIDLDAIEVMDNPALRQKFIVGLFPKPSVLKDIASLSRSRIFRFVKKNITLRVKMTAAFPIMMLVSLWDRIMIRQVKFVVFRSAIAWLTWRLVLRNPVTTATSAGYATRGNAFRGSPRCRVWTFKALVVQRFVFWRTLFPMMMTLWNNFLTATASTQHGAPPEIEVYQVGAQIAIVTSVQ